MGILDDLGIGTNEVPKDPFGFGNDYWQVTLLDFVAPKQDDGNGGRIPSQNKYADISSSGKQYGGMAVFRVMDERFAFLGANNPNQMPGQLGFGQWFQLPSPSWAQAQVPFDKNSPDGKKIVYNWVTLCLAMGYGIDEVGKLDIPDVIGKVCQAKIYPKEDENGYWGFRVAGWKPLGAKGDGGSPTGIGEFTKGGQSNAADAGGSTMSEMERALAQASASEDPADV